MSKIIKLFYFISILNLAFSNSLDGYLVVNATVSATCTLTTPSATSFASSNATTDIFVSNQVYVTCSESIPFTLTANAGTATGSTVANRLMAYNSVNFIPFNIFLDKNATVILGDGTTGTSFTGIGTGANQNIPLYTKSFSSGNYNVPGGYTSTITYTLSY